jgi:carbamoyl-phosphate synthase large subunit
MELMKQAKAMDLAMSRLPGYCGTLQTKKFEKRKAWGITRVYKMVDTCSAEFEAKTPYFYSSFEG